MRLGKKFKNLISQTAIRKNLELFVISFPGKKIIYLKATTCVVIKKSNFKIINPTKVLSLFQ
jgi:hypothetical protein